VVTYNKFNAFGENMANKLMDLVGSPMGDVLKVMLTAVAPVATNSLKADLTEIAAGNGYTAGGEVVPNPNGVRASGTLTISGDRVTFTFTGDATPFRYAALYDDTATGDPLIGWWDYGSTITPHNGDTLDIDFNNDSDDGTIFTLV
jgi:hypothetical protein